MEHPHLRHPEFGLLCPPPRLLRELRIAFTFLLIGGVAGALCVSGILGLRHSDTASLADHGSLEATVGSSAPFPAKVTSSASQDDTELGRPPTPLRRAFLWDIHFARLPRLRTGADFFSTFFRA